MRNGLRLQLLALPAILLVSALLMGSALAAPGDTTRVSIASNGTQANASSNLTLSVSLSADGRYVAFASEASNLVSGDTNGVEDVFVHDRQTGITTRVSVTSNGSQAIDFASSSPSISADGRYVAFKSDAPNLVANDTNDNGDVFVHDRQTGATTLVSVASDGTHGDSDSSSPAISADGRFVAFISVSDNLVSGDTNGLQDIFVHDRLTGATNRASVASNGSQANTPNGYSDFPSISGDGRYVVFASNARNLVSGDTNNRTDIFMHDQQTGETSRVSVASDGTQGNNASFDESTISSNGRFVAFMSEASNLVGDDTNHVSDIFVHDLQTGVTTRASLSVDGLQANGPSYAPASLSADGRYVSFWSYARNLVHDDTNGVSDVFLHDRQAGATTLVSVASDGGQANALSNTPAISGDGRFVAFVSDASNLVDQDTNGVADIFVHEYVTRPPNRSASQPAALPATGFAPGPLTRLPEQPAAKAYRDDGMTLDIPTLGVSAPIVGVPLGTDGNWDVTWLGHQAGYLDGTAFPTWNGNSVIAGHVWDADNRPGVFLGLKQLKYGDQVRVHAWGQLYIFEVRENTLVWPDQTDSVLRHEDKPWLTLLTCEDFNALFSNYTFRRAVRAVLVSVSAEP